MKMNFSQVRDFEFSLLPVGNYPAKTVAVKEVVSTNGNQMWNIQWKVIDEEFEGRIVFGRIVFGKVNDETGEFEFNEGAMPFAKNILCGYAPILELDLTSKNGFDVNLHLPDQEDDSGFESTDLVGIEVTVQVTQETNTSNGKLINVVKATVPIETYEIA